MRVLCPKGHRFNLIGELLYWGSGRRRYGHLRWTGRCIPCDKTYRFMVEGDIAEDGCYHRNTKKKAGR